MTLDAVIMAFGAIVALLPFLQFPQDWTNFLAFIAGVIILGLGIAVRRRGLRYNSASDQRNMFEKESSEEPTE